MDLRQKLAARVQELSKIYSDESYGGGRGGGFGGRGGSIGGRGGRGGSIGGNRGGSSFGGGLTEPQGSGYGGAFGGSLTEPQGSGYGGAFGGGYEDVRGGLIGYPKQKTRYRAPASQAEADARARTLAALRQGSGDWQRFSLHFIALSPLNTYSEARAAAANAWRQGKLTGFAPVLARFGLNNPITYYPQDPRKPPKSFAGLTQNDANILDAQYSVNNKPAGGPRESAIARAVKPALPKYPPSKLPRYKTDDGRPPQNRYPYNL